MSKTTAAKDKVETGTSAFGAADATKEFEALFSTGRKTLQDAFLSGTDAAEKAFKTGSEAVKTNFTKAVKDGKTQVEKATKSLREASYFDAELTDPFLTAGTTAVEKGEKISTELMDFGSGRVEACFTAYRSILKADDVQKALEVQSEFTRSAVETYATEFGKLNTMMIDATKSVMEPLGAQYAAGFDKFLKQA
ncbi:phasin family protein [Sneathiella chinensis]|uniref:Phasin domain-containing protein n=1 Tax=Sneathiella chinensis TaxID=349750 RepID=A0ABQ5UAT9_9PROT|nr:phasin family protein [Sneathiella chinensis]GLQ07691.1 hypothetical protein GCM10007924_29120 [Sneathiella chinensis]